METLFKASGMFNWPGTEANKIFFMPIMRMNALLVAASNDAVLDAAEKWIRALDDEPRDGVGTSIHVHSIRTAPPCVANVLRQIYGGAPIAQSGGSGGSGLSSDPTKVVLKGNVPTSGAGMTGSVQIIPDETTNVLVIKASPQDYLQIKKIIERIDIIPRQVLIQVMVAEITLNDETKFGVEWWLKGGQLGINGMRYNTQTALDTGMTSAGAAAKLVDSSFSPGSITWCSTASATWWA
jgi:general secretion pathway protein D